jgi:hypothetical protein
VMTFPAKVCQIVADPTIKHPHMVVKAIDHHLKSCTNGMDMWAFIAQGVFADLTHVFQFVDTESHCNTNNVKVSHISIDKWDSNGDESLLTGVKLSEDQRHTTTNDDPNITSYHPARVVLGVGATEALNYAHAITGHPYLTLETLYLMWLKHLRSCTELELCLLQLRKEFEPSTNVMKIFNRGPSKSLYLVLDFEHALCKIYQVVKVQLPSNNQSKRSNCVKNFCHPLFVGSLEDNPSVVPWGK